MDEDRGGGVAGGEDRTAVVEPSDRGQPALPSRLGPFQLLSKLGEGGMGEVWRAREAPLEREVALKLLSSRVAADGDSRQRFLREAQAAARVNHPRVVTCYQASEADGRVFMALELMPGGDASGLLRRHGGALPEVRALELVRDCAEGLVALQAAGLVHRDIKPGNVFLGSDGRAKLGDLGLAREESGADRITRTGLIVGTPAYMAPEQASGDVTLDVRADVWALGATLFHFLTGRPPFVGATAMAIVSQVLSAQAPDPGSLVPELTPGTRSLVRRMLARERDERFQDAGELLAALERALRGARAAGELGATNVVRSPSGRRIVPASSQAAALPPPPPARRLSLILPLLAAVGALGLVATRRVPETSSRGAPSPGSSTPVEEASAPAGELASGADPAALERGWQPLPGRLEAEGIPPGDLRDLGPGAFAFGPSSQAWGRATLLPGQALERKGAVRWRIIGLEPTAVADAPGEELRAQGLGAPAALFFELGLRDSPGRVTAGTDLRGEAVWVTLLVDRGRLSLLTRSLRRDRPGPLARQARVLSSVGVELDPTQPVDVYAQFDPQQGVKLTASHGGQLRELGLVAWKGDGWRMARAAHPWTHLGNWAGGSGRASVQVALGPFGEMR